MGQTALSNEIMPRQLTGKQNRLRFITATSLFDGHDAAINVMRRILQSQGAEVIHLGHNRTVDEIVTAAIQEDVDAIAVSSYQGGHLEFYKYLVDQLKIQQASAIKIFGGGGGVILPDEILQLQAYGVTRIYSPEDGQNMGLQGMIKDVMRLCAKSSPCKKSNIPNHHWLKLAHTLSQIESGTLPRIKKPQLYKTNKQNKTGLILGITGPGGAGKSSLTDELIHRFRSAYQDQLRIAIIAVDPTRKKTGGALLGDRIRMNAIDSKQIFMRSMATREASTEIPDALPEFITTLQADGFDLIIVETPGIGQGDSGIVSLVDLSLYVMTSEFGAGTQLEKLSMLDFSDIVAVNKFDRKGSEDALRDVQKQMQRNSENFSIASSKMPVYGTIASQMNNPGITALYQKISSMLIKLGLPVPPLSIQEVIKFNIRDDFALIPVSKQRYLGDIAESINAYHQHVDDQGQYTRELQYFKLTRDKLGSREHEPLTTLITDTSNKIDPHCTTLLNEWSETKKRYHAKAFAAPNQNSSAVVDCINLFHTTLSGLHIPKVALPDYHDQGDLLKWLMLENIPGSFPYTAGVFPFKSIDEVPTRMFAGEGDAFRTNRRFKFLASHTTENRLSTAFDSVTLYGCDPDKRPDIFGKIGNAGVSVATLDDMKVLYRDFDLCDPKTSVSMTINGPAPTILAMFFNTAIDQQISRFRITNKRAPNQEESIRIKQDTLRKIRGTVQADILKEDQGQNTCLFSTEFSLKIMGDIQEYFIQQQVRHFYSISISGYHIAEAGANPITQLAFTLANGFTYIEAFLAREMKIDDFAHRFSFFFSNGMDPEYSVIGRVARRIWAIALRDHYGAGERSQKLKYHIQTSGRSLHAQAIDFNEIRTTLQALIAIYDNCNSLHTNAKDEALTTPTEASVSNALAIQMIINKEWGLAKNENPNQGAFIIEQLTNLVEQAVLLEFKRLSSRGGVLGAMETAYQRSKIQEESLQYEAGKHNGSLPIIGVNLSRIANTNTTTAVSVARSTDEEKFRQISRLQKFKQVHSDRSAIAIENLKKVALNNHNIFTELMNTVRYCSLGQITQALFEVGGKYRRSM